MKSFTLRTQSFRTINVLGTILSIAIVFAGSSLLVPALANGLTKHKHGDPVKEINVAIPGAELPGLGNIYTCNYIADGSSEEPCTCNNITNGGTIGSNQTITNGGDPAPFTNITSPSGGSGTIEYLWLQSSTIPCPAIGDASWVVISGATSATYNSGPLNSSTCFLRCSRRAGCSNYDGESNSVTVTVENDCACPGNLVLNPSFESGTSNWTTNNGTLSIGTYAAQCGTYAGHFLEGGGSGNGGAYQDITGIAPGTGININVYGGVHNAAFLAYVAVEFYNGGTFISSIKQEVNAILPNMAQYNLSGNVPSGATKVRVTFYANQDWIKTDMWCLTTTTCNASITGLLFNKMDGGTDIAITNGGSYQLSAISGLYNLEAAVTSGSESAFFTVTGPSSGTVTENAEPYNYPGTGSVWSPAAGSYTVNVKIYSADNLGGLLCDEQSFTFTLTACNNVTSGGTIGNNQVACNASSFNPVAFVNLAFPSGGSGTMEYMWMKATGSTCPPIGDPAWQVIAGASSATYDSPVITQSTCFLRCARRAGCTEWAGESNIITVKLSNISLSTTQTNVSCNGGANGSINLTVSGGVSPYTYAWSTGATTQNISGRTAGTYTVTVTDAIGCTKTTAVTITQPATIVLSTSVVNVQCNGGSTGSVTLTVSGGQSPYSYAWSSGATTQNISNRAAGTYTVTVTDANGCTKTTSATITQPSVLALTRTAVNVLCFGGATGSIDLTVTGGTTPYSYAWSNSATTQDISGLSAATYTVTVTDANGCTKTTSATITQPSTGLKLATTKVNVLCNGAATGSIDLSLEGGTMPYAYSWSNGATTQDISNLAAGIYTVTVTDANSCTVLLLRRSLNYQPLY